MTIADIKAKIGVNTINLEICLDEEDKKTEWLRSWDNDDRISIVMKEETANKIKENPKRDDLMVVSKDKISEGSKLPYRNHVVFVNDNFVMSL